MVPLLKAPPAGMIDPKTGEEESSSSSNNSSQPRFVRCKVRKEDGGLFPKYTFSFQKGANLTTNDGSEASVAMIAEKQMSLLEEAAGGALVKPSKYYIFDVSRTGRHNRRHMLKKSSNYLGKIKRNATKGKSFQLFNANADPCCEEVGAFTYDLANHSDLRMSMKGLKSRPRRLTATFPKIDETTRLSRSSKATVNHELALTFEKESDGVLDLMAFQTKDPRFDAETGFYRLDFGSCATVASTRNMQMVDAQGAILFQMGRIGREEAVFNLDYRYVARHCHVMIVVLGGSERTLTICRCCQLFRFSSPTCCTLLLLPTPELLSILSRRSQWRLHSANCSPAMNPYCRSNIRRNIYYSNVTAYPR
jgi:hypothetical protein